MDLYNILTNTLGVTEEFFTMDNIIILIGILFGVVIIAHLIVLFITKILK